jgi:hypothetical protein
VEASSLACFSLAGYECPKLNGYACHAVCGDGIVIKDEEECDELSIACTGCKVNEGTDWQLILY